MMIFLLFMVIFVASSSADCGCLKCSKHLQGVDIPGPNGCPLKVVFQRPKQCDDDCRGRCYTARIEAPMFVSGPAWPVHRDYNQQYFPKQCCDCGEQRYSGQIQDPYSIQQNIPCRLLNNLKYRCDTVLVPTRKCAEAGQYCCRDTPSYPTNPTFERPDCCSDCDCCLDRSEPDNFSNNFNNNKQKSSCGVRNKRSINAVDACSHDPVKVRNKRDLAKSGYKFLMGMLPQFVREPLHHSIQGTYVPPKPTLKDKLDELKLKKLAANLKPSYYDYEEAAPSYLPSKKFNHHWAPSFDNHYSQPKYSSGINRQSKLFGTKKPLPTRYSEEEPFFSSNYKYGSSLLPKFSMRTKQSGTKVEEAVLLRKLKKLNGNPYSTNIKDQANDFMQDLIKPDHKKSKRSVEDLKRQKRTIILSSDEIDLPPHYEVDFVSVEDDGRENALEDLEASEEYSTASEEDPIVGNRPFRRQLAPSSRRLFPFLPKPEVVMGKTVIKQAVRDELNAYHKKLEQDQKIKEIRTNMERRKQEASIIPHNPIFLLLTAPMKFLKHFHDINKGVNPVMTSLPKLVYTTKKYFRDFGKNFHKNCLNLASDVIGDFDHVPSQVVQSIQPNELRRYRRESDGRVKKNVDDDELNNKQESKQFKDKQSIEAALKPESFVSVESKSSEDTKTVSFFQEFSDPNINTKELGSKEDAGHNESAKEDKVDTETQKSIIDNENDGLLDKFFRLVKDLLNPKLSVSPNDSTIENDSETEDVKVEMNTNSDPSIATDTKKSASGEKSDIVDSEEGVDSEEDDVFHPNLSLNPNDSTIENDSETEDVKVEMNTNSDPSIATDTKKSASGEKSAIVDSKEGVDSEEDDVLDPNLSLNPNDSTIETDSETEDVKVELYTNSDPSIATYTKKSASGEKSAIVDSEEGVDSEEDDVFDPNLSLNPNDSTIENDSETEDVKVEMYTNSDPSIATDTKKSASGQKSAIVDSEEGVDSEEDDVLDPNLSLSPNDSTIENDSETEDVIVEMYTNPDPSIATDTKKSASGVKSAIVGSEEGVDSDEDDVENYSGLSIEEFVKPSLEYSNNKKIIEDLREYDYKNGKIEMHTNSDPSIETNTEKSTSGEKSAVVGSDEEVDSDEDAVENYSGLSNEESVEPTLEYSDNKKIIDQREYDYKNIENEMHTNSDPSIETNTKKSASGEKSAIVGSEEGVDSEEDAGENYSGLSDEEFEPTSEYSNNKKIIEGQREYDYEASKSDSELPANKGTNEGVKVTINVGRNEAADVELSTNKNIEDSIASNGKVGHNKILKEFSDPPDDSVDLEMNHNLGPQYSLAFENSKETQNFRLVPEAHVRKKRYVVKVVDDGELQDQVEQYLTQKMDDQFSYLKPVQDYYEKVNKFLTKLHSGSEDFQATDQDEMDYEDLAPKRRVLQIKKVKPRVIIDNKGIPFMEYDGFKRPLLMKRKYMKHSSSVEKDKSSEETGIKIATLIARAKEDSEVVRSDHKDINGEQVIKERISFLLEEIDQLVHLNAEDYDEIFEDLIKIQNIKTSIEQDWKRILIDNRVSDINAKIRLLTKFKDLQQIKDVSVKNIAKALEKNDNEFVRCQLVKSLLRLQKLQSLITSVAEDFEQHLKTKTSFNTKKEIKFVDFLSELNFVHANTRNDLVKRLCQDRDVEGQKNIATLHKLKKLLATSQGDSEKFQQAAKLVWEMKHMEKLQKQTIQGMNKKLTMKFKIKKELKILFDLQKRFEDCVTELNQLLGNLVNKTAAVKFGQKKDIKNIIAEMKHKHEERLLKIKGKTSGLQKLKKS